MIVLALGTFTWILLGLFAVALIVAVVRAVRDEKVKEGGLLNEAPAIIEDAQVGDIVTISDFDPDLDNRDLLVEKKNRYESGGSEWFELLAVYEDCQVWIDLEVDDALRISVTRPERSMSLSKLQVTEQDLASMDEEESLERFIEWDGQNYYYRKSCKVGFFSDCSGSGQGFYLWEFEGEDRQSLLCIEKWEEGRFDISVGKVIHPNQVKLDKR